MRMDTQHPREDGDKNDAKGGKRVRHIPRTRLRLGHWTHRMGLARCQSIRVGPALELLRSRICSMPIVDHGELSSRSLIDCIRWSRIVEATKSAPSVSGTRAPP